MRGSAGQGDGTGPSRRRKPCLFLALGAVIAIAACRDREPTPATRESGPWLTAVNRDTRRRPGDLSHCDLAALTLPDVSRHGFDADFREPRYIVNLESNGNIYFKGHSWAVRSRWRSASDGGPRPATAAEREESFENLRSELATICERFAHRSADGTSPVSILLRADREMPWSEVAETIRVLRAPTVRIDRLQIAVTAAEPGYGGRIDAKMEHSADAAGTPGALRIHLTHALGDAVAVVPIGFALGETSWVFPRVKSFEDEAAVAQANLLWSALAAAIHAGGLAGAAEVSIDADVPWAYVAETLSLLLEAGARDVTVPDQELTLRLADPPPFTPFHIGDPSSEDWPPAVALGIGALAAVAVFALGRWALRRRPRAGASPMSRNPGNRV